MLKGERCLDGINKGNNWMDLICWKKDDVMIYYRDIQSGFIYQMADFRVSTKEVDVKFVLS
jgi:hypothetical protein